MPPPFKRIGKQRAKLHQDSEKQLEKLLSKQQQTFLKRIVARMSRELSIRNGIIQNANYEKILESDYFQNAWQREFGKPVGDLLTESLKRSLGLNKQYFETQYASNAATLTTEIVQREFGIVSSAFINSYKQSTEVAQTVKRLVLGAIQRGISFAEFEAEAKTLIEGDAQKLGIAENYTLYKTRVQDSFAEYDRAVQDSYAKRLNLNYCIYQGGEIETTREFCDERNGKVFTRDEVLSWQNLEWQGKKTDHRIMLDCGGYNCRHVYNWISREVAEQLRPGIPVSKFDIPQ